MTKKKTKKDVELLLNSNEFEILSKLDIDNICSDYDWCGEYSDDCEKCPVQTLLNKIRGAENK